MKRDDALTILQNNRDELRRRGVARAALFGSTVRDQAEAGSDVDVLVEIDPKANIGVYEYVAITRYLGELFAGRVDVANRATLQPAVRPSAEREAVYAF
ncbi:MAG TPA: nucleotidyltransferase family protein [Caulobacteraceae bacterium]